MAIPDYQSVMLPLLRLAADGREHSAREAVEQLADHFSLSEDERKELLPSGAQATFDNRVGWARTYMKKAGLLESPRRGYFKITQRGIQVLKQNPDEINNKLLEQYKEFRAFKAKSGTKRTTAKVEVADEAPEQTPLEVLHVPNQAPCLPPSARSVSSLTPNHPEHQRHLPKHATGPGTIQSRSRSGSQHGSQSTPVPSPSLRRQVFRATASWPHLSQRTSRLALDAAARAVQIVLADREPDAVLLAAIGVPGVPAARAPQLPLLDRTPSMQVAVLWPDHADHRSRAILR